MEIDLDPLGGGGQAGFPLRTPVVARSEPG
jgi:hypothetical protein